MIDIPLGKAFAAVESQHGCEGCDFYVDVNCEDISCKGDTRKDGKDVIFKLVDYPAKGE